MTDLVLRRCKPCEGGTAPLHPDAAREMVRELAGWELNEAKTEIFRDFQFKDFHQTMAFVNAVAWIAHQEDHHPMLEVGYSWCVVRYSTHAIKGLSENDFICAAKANALLGGA